MSLLANGVVKGGRGAVQASQSASVLHAIARGERPPPPRVGGTRSWISAYKLGLTFVILALMAVIDSKGTETRVRLTREYDLKAAFLFNFTQFVEWPPEAFSDRGSPITIGILGEDPFGKSLDEIVANEVVRSRKLVVRRFHDVGEIGMCHVLFVSRSHIRDLGRLGERGESKHILTVGETEGFTAKSGIIRFDMIENKVRLAINVKAAKAAGLSISSKLLRQAEIVGSEGSR